MVNCSDWNIVIQEINMPTLKNWFTSRAEPDNVYKPPENGALILAGEVYDRAGFEDGERVKTSAIVARNGDKVVTASGTEYELGDIEPGFAEKYPDARQHLLNQLPDVSP